MGELLFFVRMARKAAKETIFPAFCFVPKALLVLNLQGAIAVPFTAGRPLFSLYIRVKDKSLAKKKPLGQRTV